MAIQNFIKWSGSKRSQAKEIISYFPQEINTYYEPFLGSGAILGHLKPQKAVCADINKPLMELWEKIKNDPKGVSQDYRNKWENLQNKGYTFFYEVRINFN